jgi:HEAT repeat protein/beta-lactamase regulating signal transducer with metallopeptidase domain
MNFSFPELSSAMPHPGSWLPVVDAVLKSTLLLALTGATALLLRRASAAARHCVWTLGLAGALILPALSIALPRWEMPVVRFEAPAASPAATLSTNDLPELRAPAPRLDRDADLAVPISSAVRTPEPTDGAVQPPIQESGSDPGALVLTIWLAGVLAILGRLIVGLLAVQWMSRRTERVGEAPWLPLARELADEIGIRGNLTFLRSGRATMPMAWGIFRPSVLMPADADIWRTDRLRIVLLHELAHVKRRDCLTHALAQVACAVYWFNPLVWIAARHVRAERERAADDLVLAAGTRGSDYADQLLEIATVMRGGRFPALLTGATLAMAHRTQLEGRLIAILDPKVPRSGVSRVRTAVATALAACALLPLATLRPWAYAEPAQTFELTQSLPAPTPVPERPSPAPWPVPQPAPEPRIHTEPVPVENVAAATAQTALEGLALRGARSLAEALVQGTLEGVAEGVIGAVTQTAEKRQGTAKRTETDPRTVAALTAALKDSDAEVREAAMHALVQLRDPSVYEPLVAALRDSSVDIREQAVFALGQLGDPRAIQPLTTVLKDQSASVREAVIFALGQLRDKGSAAAIAQALKDESASVREQAAFALGQLHEAAYVDALAAALKDSSADVREQAAFALGQLGDKRAAAALTSAMSDNSDSVREQAVFALGQLGDAGAIDSLAKALRDTKPDIREQAAFALGQIGDARAVAPLISALKDSDAEVRHQAAFALGQIGDRAAVEALVIAMKDDSGEVREQVAFALGQLRDPRAIEALTNALKDASVEVRRQAAFALGQIAR